MTNIRASILQLLLITLLCTLLNPPLSANQQLKSYNNNPNQADDDSHTDSHNSQPNESDDDPLTDDNSIELDSLFSMEFTPIDFSSLSSLSTASTAAQFELNDEALELLEKLGIEKEMIKSIKEAIAQATTQQQPDDSDNRREDGDVVDEVESRQQNGDLSSQEESAAQSDSESNSDSDSETETVSDSQSSSSSFTHSLQSPKPTNPFTAASLSKAARFNTQQLPKIEFSEQIGSIANHRVKVKIITITNPQLGQSKLIDEYIKQQVEEIQGQMEREARQKIEDREEERSATQQQLVEEDLQTIQSSTNRDNVATSSTDTAASNRTTALLSLLTQAQQLRFGLPTPHSYKLHFNLQLYDRRHVDIHKAIGLYRRAVDEYDSVSATNALAEIALRGEASTTVDFPQAQKRFQRIAEKGHSPAQHHLALMHTLGFIDFNTSAFHTDPTALPDPFLSTLFLTFASQAGFPLASQTLAYRASLGLNVEKSCGEAVVLYKNLARSVVSTLASHVPDHLISLVERHRLNDEEAFDSTSIEEEEDVVAWYMNAAQRGNANAATSLAWLYLYGTRGFLQNATLAYELFSQAMKAGSMEARAVCGWMTLFGIGREKDEKRAWELLTHAAVHNHPIALTYKAYMHITGSTVNDEDYKAALLLLKRAADQFNHPEAQFLLGIMYYEGMGVMRRYATAAHYWTAASMSGHIRAAYHLALLHYTGLGVVESCEASLKLFKAVVERGAKWSRRLNVAYQLYRSGHVIESWHHFAELAEMGYEVAQWNSAFLLNTGRVSHLSKAHARAIAFRHLKLASQQGNIDALRVLGDYYFYGIITQNHIPNYNQSAYYYRLAAKANPSTHLKSPAILHYSPASNATIAQSKFNLAYLYITGLGVYQRDFNAARQLLNEVTSLYPLSESVVRVMQWRMGIEEIMEELGVAESVRQTMKWFNHFIPSLSHSHLSSSTDQTKNPLSNADSHDSASSSHANTVTKSQLPRITQIDTSTSIHFIHTLLNNLNTVYQSIEDIMLILLCAVFAVLVFIRQRQI